LEVKHNKELRYYREMRKGIDILKGILIVLLITVTACSGDSNKKIDVEKEISYCEKQAQKTLTEMPDDSLLPRHILKEERAWSFVDIKDWTSGFWPGILWYLYEATGDEKWETEARKYTSYLELLAFGEPTDHDLGFQIFCSYGNGYRLTSDTSYKKEIISTANKLARLYNPTVRTILSWPAMGDKMGWPHNTIIDNMMNLEMLFWASKNGGDKRLYDIAFNHAKTSMQSLIRDDFTTYHVAVFDTTDGHFIKGLTHQGYSNESRWSRGQAWGIYGFTMCYRETGYEPFLTMAKNMADVFIKLLAKDGIPYWDFDDPSIPDAPKDASAAAVAASAMLEMSSFMTNEDQKQKYQDAAIKLINKLSTEEYQSGNKNLSFLMHSTGHWPHKSEIDASIIYADYYYLEALLRAKEYLN
jgi:unsaturated chondroitin disaccharide hydrolase